MKKRQKAKSKGQKVRKIIFLLIFLFSLGKLSFGTNDNYPLGARSAGMSNATVMMPHLWSVFHNQAGLAWLDQFSVGFHHENKFVVSEYGLQAAAIIIPAAPGTIGVTYSYFGYSKYHENKIGVAFGRMLGKNISAGVQLNYLNVFIADQYGNQGNLTVEGGIMAQPVKNLFLGAHVFNPTRAQVSSDTDEDIPTIFRFGMGFRFANTIFLAVETEKDLDNPAVFKTGIEFELVDNLTLRTGFSTKPTLYTFGLGYHYKGIKANLAFTRHQQLGFTPHFSILYIFDL